MVKQPANVTDAEFAVLDALWSAGASSAREITERLYPRGNPGDVATVQKLLQRLENKGFVHRDRSERSHVFSATRKRQEFAGEQLSKLAEKLAGGSLTPLLMHLVENQRLSSRERAEIRAILDGKHRR